MYGEDTLDSKLYDKLEWKLGMLSGILDGTNTRLQAEHVQKNSFS